MSTQPLKVHFTCSDLPRDFLWRKMRPEVTDAQLQNRVEEVYLFRNGDVLIVDETISDLTKLGGTAEDINKLRERVEAAIPVPKRIKLPVWQPAALSANWSIASSATPGRPLPLGSDFIWRSGNPSRGAPTRSAVLVGAGASSKTAVLGIANPAPCWLQQKKPRHC